MLNHRQYWAGESKTNLQQKPWYVVALLLLVINVDSTGNLIVGGTNK